MVVWLPANCASATELNAVLASLPTVAAFDSVVALLVIVALLRIPHWTPNATHEADL
jgi:hypothetical protein